MRQHTWRPTLAVAGTGALTAATAAPLRATEASARYSAFLEQDETYHGWQATVGGSGRPLSFVGDVAGYHGGGGSFYIVAAGPRVSFQGGQGTSFFVQVLAGAAFAEDGAFFMAQPGLGVDFRSNKARFD